MLNNHLETYELNDPVQPELRCPDRKLESQCVRIAVIFEIAESQRNRNQTTSKSVERKGRDRN